MCNVPFVPVPYTYNDVLNRLTGKSYNDNPPTPPVSFSYDQTSVTLGTWSSGTLSNTKGRLTSAITTTSGTLQTGVVYGYDPMGRVSQYDQCPPATCGTGIILPTTTVYDPAGDIWNWTFGYTITNTISAAREITAITSSQSDSGHPATLAQNITYTPWGALSSLTDGCVGTGCTEVQETYDYNNRMQPVRLQFTTASGNYCMVYNYYIKGTNPSSCTSTPTQASTGNNGSVAGIWVGDGINTSLNRTESYSYDNVNRLTGASSASTATYNLAFIYTADGSTGQYGNMTCTTNAQTQGLCPNYTFSPSTNQVAGFTYDLAGNVLTDGSHSYSWDAEGRLATMDGGSTETITYNALGQRVNSSGGSTTYNSAGEETFSAGYYLIPWNGVNFAVDTSNTFFIHHNILNSATIATNQTGVVVQDLIFYPWGQNWLDGQGFQDNTFAGMFPLAQVSGADLFTTLNRDYDATNGRWLSPDPQGLGAHPSDPQTWNMYAYTRNNPTSLTDPSGSMYCDPNSAIVDKNGATVGYSDCVSEDTGPSDQYNLHLAPQQELVNSGAPASVPLEAAVPILTGGHHYLDQQFFRDLPGASDAFRLFNNWVTGPLSDKTANYYNGLHRAASAQIREMIEDYLTEHGRANLAQLSKDELKELAQEIVDATKDASTRLGQFYRGLKPAIQSAEGEIEPALENAWEDIQPLLEEIPPAP
jgi:RHS repeat-associated protein